MLGQLKNNMREFYTKWLFLSLGHKKEDLQDKCKIRPAKNPTCFKRIRIVFFKVFGLPRWALSYLCIKPGLMSYLRFLINHQESTWFEGDCGFSDTTKPWYWQRRGFTPHWKGFCCRHYTRPSFNISNGIDICMIGWRDIWIFLLKTQWACHPIENLYRYNVNQDRSLLLEGLFWMLFMIILYISNNLYEISKKCQFGRGIILVILHIPKPMIGWRDILTVIGRIAVT